MGLAVICFTFRSPARSVLLLGRCPFFRRHLGASALSLGFHFVFLYPVGSCLSFFPALFLLVWRRACDIVVTFSLFKRRLARAFFAFVLLPPLWSQAQRCSARGRTGWAICVVHVPLGARLVKAFKGRGIAPIGRLTGRCAPSVHPWTPTQAFILGTGVKIL